MNEGVNETGFIPASDLPISAPLFWRATAIDAANAVSSSPTTAQGFATSLAVDLSKVIQSYPAAPSGPQVAAWRQTATIQSVQQDGSPAADGIMCIAFSTSDDWPSTPFFGAAEVQVYANRWYFANIGGQWYGGPGEYLRVGCGFCKTGQGTNAIGPDGGWNTVMASWAPKVGEMVGYMISTPVRNWPGMHTIDERSDTSCSRGAIRVSDPASPAPCADEIGGDDIVRDGDDGRARAERRGVRTDVGRTRVAATGR